jgi:2,3-dihydroxyphenylpropionate 1,2-dioxygenase
MSTTRHAMLVTASHSPIIEFPEVETDAYHRVVAALDDVRAEVTAFDPELVVIFGVDHYGGHHMSCMPAFCVGVDATALADVGGTPGPLDVPRDLAVGAVDHLRRAGVDTAVSYAMDVDHGFTQALVRLTGGIDRYPVLPIFVSCIQPPFVPFRRARALGRAVADYLATLDVGRVLVIGTGGLSHNPRMLFPPIDEVGPEWRPYHLHGRAQQEVSQQAWIDYEIEAHKVAAAFLASPDIPDEAFGLHDDWDRAFLATYCAGDMSAFDSWDPTTVVDAAGIGAMEVLSWVAAGEAMTALTDLPPTQRLQQVCRVIGIGYGITSAGPAPIMTAP